MYNAVWRLERGKKSHALVKNFHAHWTTRGMDGQIYSESFQEIGGAAFRIDLNGGKHVKVAEESHIAAVATFGDSVFMLESSDSSNDGQRVRVIRGSGRVELLGQVEP